MAPDGGGIRCDWEWTSNLHAPQVMPWLGQRVFRNAIRRHRFEFAGAPTHSGRGGAVDVSFIIGHRGTDRLPQLQRTLETIAAQRDVSLECIVVEQAPSPDVRDALPSWVRYVHTPPPVSGMPYARGWALNVGAREARGAVLVLHDNDLLVPVDYAREHLSVVRRGFEVVNLKRFIFYLTRSATEQVTRSRRPVDATLGLEQILQNAQGGGSLVMTRSAFLEIGGFDEAFVGWGGEDNEIWQRALTRRLYPFGRLPLVHLWHAPQSDKRALHGRGLHTAALFEKRLDKTPEARIADLCRRPFGAPSAPADPDSNAV
jgi:hypothetical protein